jgi:putative spermidine/putrescine transport system substrate-binding protein
MRSTTKLAHLFALSLAFLLIGALVVACGENTPANGTSSGPVALQIVDAGGYMSLAKPMMESYRKAHPDKVSSITYLPRVQAPDLPGRLKTEQAAGKVETSLILSGYDGVSSSIAQGLVEQILPSHANLFPNLDANYQDPAKRYNDLANGNALIFLYTPSGPVFEYDPTKVPTPPTTIEQLRSWIKANPHRFLYARPANSGPGRTMLMGLPYLLGDKDPQDPINGWDNTWSFLKDIGSTIDSYPTRTGDVMTALAKGDAWMVASTLGWDLNPRILHQVPQGMKTFVLQNTQFVADAGFLMIPKGLDKAHLAVVLDMVAWMLKPAQQADAYDDGYFYPGPAIKNVPIGMAPKTSQDEIQQYGRPEYDSLIQSITINMPLSNTNLVAAFNKWDRDIGGAKYKS